MDEEDGRYLQKQLEEMEGTTTNVIENLGNPIVDDDHAPGGLKY